LWDLDRPFEHDATLAILKFDDDDEAKAVSLFFFFLRDSPCTAFSRTLIAH
jgi:hypothetical protein